MASMNGVGPQATVVRAVEGRLDEILVAVRKLKTLVKTSHLYELCV